MAGHTVSGLYDVNPTVFGQSNLLIKSTKDVGDDTRVFNGVDVTSTSAARTASRSRAAPAPAK